MKAVYELDVYNLAEKLSDMVVIRLQIGNNFIVMPEVLWRKRRRGCARRYDGN